MLPVLGSPSLSQRLASRFCFTRRPAPSLSPCELVHVLVEVLLCRARVARGSCLRGRESARNTRFLDVLRNVERVSF